MGSKNEKTYICKTLEVAVLKDGDDTASYRNTYVSLDNDCGVEDECLKIAQGNGENEIIIYPEEWNVIKEVCDMLINQCTTTSTKGKK